MMLWLLIPGFIINNLAETGDEEYIVWIYQLHEKILDIGKSKVANK